MKSILLFFLFAPLVLLAQKETNHWAFGMGYHMDFSTEPPTVTRDLNRSAFSGATISDSTGKLLFYTNGETIWNANGSVAENGTDIGGWDSSSPHTSIVPIPYTNRYYVFSCGYHTQLHPNYHDHVYNLNRKALTYALVEFKNNKAKVLQKNVELWENIVYQFSVTLHANKEDVWVVTLDKRFKTDSLFVAWQMGSCGVKKEVLSLTKIIRHRGDSRGSIGISPNGKYLLHAGYAYSFNTTTGKIDLIKQFAPDEEQTSRLHPGWTADSKQVLTVEAYNRWIMNNYHVGSFFEVCAQDITYNIPTSHHYQLGLDGHIYYGVEACSKQIKRINTQYPFCPKVRMETIHNAPSACLVPPIFPNYFFDPNYKSPPKEYPMKATVSRVCQGNATSFALTTKEDTQVTIQYAVMGNGDTLYPNTFSFDYNYTAPGIYKGFFVCERKCFTQNVPFTVVVDTEPVLDLAPTYNFYHCKEFGVPFVIDSIYNTSILWSDGATGFKHFISKSNDYEVTVKNTCGELTSDFEIEELVVTDVPNTITPNNDGKNDVLVIKNLPENAFFTISNRWGQLIYETANYQNDWPNEQLVSGVYFYDLIIEGDCKHRGWVTIME